jgi:hypothetical protein
VPASVAEGCLEMLRETGLLALNPGPEDTKPARPIEGMTIGQFWVVDEHATGRAGDPRPFGRPRRPRTHWRSKSVLRELPGAGVTLGELSARG